MCHQRCGLESCMMVDGTDSTRQVLTAGMGPSGAVESTHWAGQRPAGRRTAGRGRLDPGRELQPGQRRLLPQRWAADQRPLDVLGRQQAINLRFDEIVIGLGGEIEGVGPSLGARPLFADPLMLSGDMEMPPRDFRGRYCRHSSSPARTLKLWVTRLARLSMNPAKTGSPDCATNGMPLCKDDSARRSPQMVPLRPACRRGHAALASQRRRVDTLV